MEHRKPPVRGELVDFLEGHMGDPYGFLFDPATGTSRYPFATDPPSVLGDPAVNAGQDERLSILEARPVGDIEVNEAQTARLAELTALLDRLREDADAIDERAATTRTELDDAEAAVLAATQDRDALRVLVDAARDDLTTGQAARTALAELVTELETAQATLLVTQGAIALAQDAIDDRLTTTEADLVAARDDLIEAVALNAVQTARLDELQTEADDAVRRLALLERLREIQGENLCPNGMLHVDPSEVSTFAIPAADYPQLAYDSTRAEIVATVDKYLPFYGAMFAIDSDRNVSVDVTVRGTAGTRMYFGLQAYDSNRSSMQSEMMRYRVGSITELVQPFAPGDTVMYLADVSAWVVSTSNSGNGLCFVPIGGYESGRVVGKAADGYSRFALNDTRQAGSGKGYTIDTAANTLTFAEPVTNSRMFNAGATWPVGTTVRQPYSRGGNMYTVSNHISAGEWYTRRVNLSPIEPTTAASSSRFSRATHFMRWIWLCNYRPASTDIVEQRLREIMVTQY